MRRAARRMESPKSGSARSGGGSDFMPCPRAIDMLVRQIQYGHGIWEKRNPVSSVEFPILTYRHSVHRLQGLSNNRPAE